MCILYKIRGIKSGIGHGSFKDHIPSTPGWLYVYQTVYLSVYVVRRHLHLEAERERERKKKERESERASENPDITGLFGTFFSATLDPTVVGVKAKLICRPT